jgi:PAS domain S-box-containing protein
MQESLSSIAAVGAVLGKAGVPAPLVLSAQLIDALPVPVFFKSRDGRYLGMNKAWESFFGMPRDTYIGQTVHALYPDNPAVVQRHLEEDQELWDNPGMRSYELAVTPEGRRRHIIMFKATFNDERGQVAGLVGTIIDITERRQAEQRQAMEHAVSRLLDAPGGLPDAVAGIIRALCEQLGWACGARWVYDKTGRELHCVETWSEAEPAVAAFMDENRQRRFAPGQGGLIRRALATGAPVWIEDIAGAASFSRGPAAAQAGLRSAFALPVKEGGRVLGALEFFSRAALPADPWLLDFGASLGSQIGQLMARREAEARFRSLIQLSSDWYWEQDEELRFTMLSDGMTEKVGVATEDFIGKTRWETSSVDLSDADWAAHKATLEARLPFRDFEMGRRDAKGGIYYVSISGEPMFDEAGRFSGYRGVGRDITRRKKALAELSAAHRELERKARDLARSNEELQQFAYVASHDLQEPLRMISSYTQLLGRRYDDKLDDDAREFMGFIVDGAARMKQLIEDLLAYSRVGTRGHELAPTDCNGALQTALSNLRASVESSGAAVTHDSLPVAMADDSQLPQLFQNLIGNAIKFRGAAAPRIHVSARDLGSAWRIDVSDNGIGLEAQYAERIFLMFQRLHSRAEYPGTGIGLAICKKIVERHGGRIGVESEPGRGSTFHFTLPKAGGPRIGDAHG